MSDPTPIENVFSALQNAPTYHPASANLFTDWLIQAGDVVTVSSDNESYSLPIFNLEMTWNGSSMVTVDATGKEKRDPPSALQRRSYGASQTAADVDGIHTRLIQDENKIGLVVEQTSGGNVIKAASIMAAINDDTSSVKISADKVVVTGTTIKIGDVIKTYQNVRLVDTDFLTASLTQTSVLQIGTGGTASTWQTVTPDSVSDVQVVVSGNGYKLQKKTWGDSSWQDAGTFSRAATIYGTWSSGTYTVSASAGTVNALSTTLSNVSGANSITTNGTYTYKVMYEDDQGNDQETGLTKSVTVNVPTGSVTSDDISIGGYVNVSTEPSASSGPAYTTANTMRDTMIAAMNNHNWFGFTVYYKSSTAVRRYKMKFS